MGKINSNENISYDITKALMNVLEFIVPFDYL